MTSRIADSRSRSAGTGATRDAWRTASGRRCAGPAPSGTLAALRALDDSGFDAMFDRGGVLAPLYDAKRTAARDLLAAVRAALDAVPGPRLRLEPQAFPPPFHQISGFPLASLGGIADAVGIKLYTMHWPMIARYWARDLLGDAKIADHDAVTAAVAHRFGFTDGIVDGNTLRIPRRRSRIR
jgi:hypothetical protein